MDRSTRSELVRTVEEQNQKITKYEGKLRDLIRAYKGLQKEKDALEASVKILSSSSRRDDQDGKEQGETEGVEGSGSRSEEDWRPESSQTEVLKLKEQLATLTNSLATVSEEKTRMEANYQADKKKLRLEHEEIVQQLEESCNRSDEKAQDLQGQVKELKSRLIIHQHERDKEQTDHAMMLKELQGLVAEERNAKEQMQLQLEEAQFTLKDHQRMLSPPDMTDQYRKKISDLSNEIQDLKEKLKMATEKANRPSPLLLQLQKETAEIKIQHKMTFEQEQKRANEAEERAKNQSLKSESRVATLEARISELSEVVGNYERLRYQDQQAIQRLRERVTQLDLENTALAKGADTNNDLDIGDEDKNLDVQGLVDKIIRLKGMLKQANDRSEKPINIDELLTSEGLVPESDLHKQCKEDYNQVKEEFERYKLRAQSVLKNKTSKETVKEMEILKNQITELREKLRDQHMLVEDQQCKHQEALGDLRKAMTSLQERHKNELTAMEAEHRQKISDLELQIRKHRDRTISLLAEKDKEIEMLRINSPEQLETQYLTSYRQLSLEGDESSSSDAAGASSEENTAINQLLSKSSMLSGQGETSILHFAQEQARKDVEIKSLRKQKLSLESALRELQISSSTKQQKYVNELDLLHEEVRKHERNQSRESANLEYLKNVIYQYLVCNDWTGKTHMLNAISTILEFSPAEKRYVDEVLHQGWIQYYAGYSPSAKVKGKK